MIRPPCDIQPDETIGRRVSSERDARTCATQSARQASLPLRVFRHNCRYKVSTDRLRDDYYLSVKVIAQEYDERRSRRFFGWAVIKQETIACAGHPLIASPQCDNPFHADIVLPKCVLKSREQYHDAIVGLAAEAWWQDVNEDYAHQP